MRDGSPPPDCTLWFLFLLDSKREHFLARDVLFHLLLLY
jgi:hypothetical protein